MKKLYVIIETSKEKIWQKNDLVVIKAILKTFQHLIGFFKEQILDKVLMVSVLLSNDVKIKKMNAKYRHQNRATNILSFQNIKWDKEEFSDFLLIEQIEFNKGTCLYEINESEAVELNPESLIEGKVLQLGNIVISYERILEESKEQQKEFKSYLSFITTHGILHLMGYDHEEDDEAEEMGRIEREIMQKV